MRRHLIYYTKLYDKDVIKIFNLGGINCSTTTKSIVDMVYNSRRILDHEKDGVIKVIIQNINSNLEKISEPIFHYVLGSNLSLVSYLYEWPGIDKHEILEKTEYLSCRIETFMNDYYSDGIAVLRYIFENKDLKNYYYNIVMRDASCVIQNVLNQSRDVKYKVKEDNIKVLKENFHKKQEKIRETYKFFIDQSKKYFDKQIDKLIEVLYASCSKEIHSKDYLLLHFIIDNINHIMAESEIELYKGLYAAGAIKKLFEDNTEIIDGKTSLQRAAEHLKQYDSDLTLYTPLHRAIQKGENVIAMQLVKLGGFGVTQLDNGVNILNHCITEKNIDLLQDIINNPRLDIKSFVMPTKKHPDFDEINTPLFQAVAEGKVKMLKELIMCYRDTKDCYNNRHIIGYILNYGQSHKKEMIELLVSPEITKLMDSQAKVLWDISAASELVRMFNSEEDEGIKEYLEDKQQIIKRALLSCMNGGIEYMSMMKCLFKNCKEIDDEIQRKSPKLVKILKKTTGKSVEKHPDFEIVNTPLLQAVINGETETIRKLINANKESCTNQLYYATDLDTGSHIFEYILRDGGSKKKEMFGTLVSEKINFCDLRVGYALVDMFNSNENNEFREFLAKDPNLILRSTMIRFMQEGLVYISQIECLFRNGAKITDAIRKKYPEHVKILDSLNVETKAETCEEINIEDQLLQASSQDLNVEPAGEESTTNDALAA